VGWQIVFKLYDTYGFPVELTQEIAKSKGIEVDLQWFKKFMDQAKEQSRKATQNVFKRWIDWAKYLEWIPPTEFVWYENLELENPKLLKDFEIEINWKLQRVLVFDRTPFYAESWWQTWDKGEIILDDGKRLRVIDVQKYAGVFLHFVE
jgi:alanyl-tRNA synthetase